MNSIKYKSINSSQKNKNNLIKNKNISNNPKLKTNNKKFVSGRIHRSSISTDFSLNLEFGNMINNNKANKDNNTKGNKNKLIKVNTTRNNYINNLSLRNQTKTNKKYSKNKKSKNFESLELFKNASEINIFKNINNNKNNQNKYDINKIIYIQKWWKNIFLINKNEYNSLVFLINCIKKYILIKPYLLIKNNPPLLSYFLHKWYNIVNKKKILQYIFNNSYKINNIKDKNKEKNNTNKISPKKNNNQELLKVPKKFKINNKLLLNNKKKLIAITIKNNNNSGYSKNKDNNICCQTSKHSKNNKINYINFNINKKQFPYSPKANSITERYTSPLNNLSKKLQTKKTSLKYLDTKLFRKSENNNKEKKSNKLKSKTNNNPKYIKNLKKNIGENIIEKNINAKLDKIISHNNSNSKNETPSNYEDINTSLFLNPNSQFNHYILNINKKDILFSPQFSKGEKKENTTLHDDFNLLINTKNNNKSQYYNTEAFSNNINTIFKTKISKSNSKVYENYLYKDSKYKKELFNKINLNEIKIIKSNKNIPINKHVILHKKENDKITINKEFSNHKKNIKSLISNNTSNIPKSETNSMVSKVSSIENSSNKRKIIFTNNNSYLYNYFHFWKEFINKKIIFKKLKTFSKFMYLINHYKKIIILKNSIQKIIKVRKKEKLYEYILRIINKKIINILKAISKYKKNNMNNMKEIKIFKKNNNYNNIVTYFKREKGDIINNININNYIRYDGYNSLKKRKPRSPNLPKVIEFKTSNTNNINSNSNNDYYNKRLTLAYSNSDKYIDFYRHSNNTIFNYNDNNKNPITYKNNNDKNDDNKINKINNDILIKNNSGYLKNGVVSNSKIKNENGNGVIVDQINQLKMVFNLLERHNKKTDNKSYSLLNCFNKWKLFSVNRIKIFNAKTVTPKISEKIINLKPFQSSKIVNNFNNKYQDMSLKKNFSLNKMTPKIINVINVQNFNENNNYNYNFKYMPIKDIPIYPRNSYGYNNINEINTKLNNIGKTNINDNIINSNINNNNLNTTPFIMLNDNKHNNPNIIYHKKKLGSTFVNNNYNFTFNNNIDNIVNNNNFNNLYYNLDKKGNYDNSSLLLYDPNQSEILFPELTNKIYNIENNNSMNLDRTIFRENSYKDLRTFISKEEHPEQKFGFKKLNQIEEKEINFENNNNKKIYYKKQYFEGKKTKYQNDIISNIFKKEDNNDNLIKCLNVQFGKTCKELFQKDNINNIEYENDKCITISEDNNGEKNKIYDKIEHKNNIKTIYNKIMDNDGLKENEYRINKMKYKLIKGFSNNEFKNVGKIKDKILNHSFEIYSNINKDFKIEEMKNNYITI